VLIVEQPALAREDVRGAASRNKSFSTSNLIIDGSFVKSYTEQSYNSIDVSKREPRSYFAFFRMDLHRSGLLYCFSVTSVP
jgi:hypothetical protein